MVTLDDLQGQAVCSVPEAGQILGLGKSAAYAAAASGRIPTLQLGERRVVVPVPRFLELLGATKGQDDQP